MEKPSKNSPAFSIKWLQIEDFEYLCFDFTRQYLTFDQPIPDYSTRDTALLESALGSPQQTFGGNLLYPTLVKQAAILFYSLIKNHPFKNGNKRIAVISLLVFLSLNSKWLSVLPGDLYKLALDVSNTKPEEKQEAIEMIESVVDNNLDEYPQVS